MKYLLDLWIITIEGRIAQENTMFIPLSKTFDHSNSPKEKRIACVIH